MNSKAIWKSKTLWVNIIAIIALIAQTYTGFIIGADKQVVILGIINTLLRFVTKTPLDWGNDQQSGEQGFVAIRLLPLLVMAAMLLMFCSCATTDTPQSIATKSLLAMKDTIVATAVVGDRLCKAGRIAPDTCQDLAGYYILAGPAYDLAADSLAAAVKYDNADSWEKYNQAVQYLGVLYLDITSIGTKTGLIKLTDGGAK